MNVHIVVVAYGLAEDLRRLFESADGPGVTWHVFLHSQFPEVVEICYELGTRRNVWLYPYGVNRGLARSWNEGLYNAYRDSCDAALIANDDALAGPGDVQRIVQAALAHPDCYLIQGTGIDLREKRRGKMHLALAAINPIALETIGYFDTAFEPIYYEDQDYYRRAELAGLKDFVAADTAIVHAGSKSLYEVAGQKELHQRTFGLNQEYYIGKWGGLPGQETYTRPWNDPEAGLYEGYQALTPDPSPSGRGEKD